MGCQHRAPWRDYNTDEKKFDFQPYAIRLGDLESWNRKLRSDSFKIFSPTFGWIQQNQRNQWKLSRKTENTRRCCQVRKSSCTAVVSIGRLTTFYVVLVTLELIPSEPPLYAYFIVLFCNLQKDLHLHTKGYGCDLICKTTLKAVKRPMETTTSPPPAMANLN